MLTYVGSLVRHVVSDKQDEFSTPRDVAGTLTHVVISAILVFVNMRFVWVEIFEVLDIYVNM